MTTSLLIHIPGQTPHQVELTKDSYTIGRSSENDIVVNAPMVSRRHGRLTREGEDWVYINLSTSNGTCVDGELVQTVRLQDGTRLQLGEDSGQPTI